MSKKIQFDQWIKEAFPAERERPEGSFTAEEAAEKAGLSLSHIHNVLKEKVRTGELTTGKFIEDNGRPKNYYLINQNVNVSKGSTAGHREKNKRNSKAK